MSGASLIGITLGGKYKLIKQIGHGGMSTVYLGHQEALNRDVAVKVMHSFLVHEPGFLQRFKREAQAMATLNHPRIVGVYDFAREGDDLYYLAMEYIKGHTLKDVLERLAKQQQLIPLNACLQIIADVADAMSYAHFHGMVHRDIKSGNIMVNEKGNVYLTDFGIVKMVGGQGSMVYTTTGALIGTPAYMSPEQALGKPGDERSDIYSLGVLLYQLATGKLPFEGESALSVVMKHVNEQPPLPIEKNPSLPLGVQDTILKAMAKEPPQRFQSAVDMAKMLRDPKIMTGRPLYPTPPPPELRLPPPALLATESTIQNKIKTEVALRKEQSVSENQIKTERPLPNLSNQPSSRTSQNQQLRSSKMDSKPGFKSGTSLKDPALQTVACPHCRKKVDVRDHTDPMNCPHCQKSFYLQDHLCPYCQTYHTKEAIVCSECGQSLNRMCHHCFTANWVGDDDCKNCGKPLDLVSLLEWRTPQATAERLNRQMAAAQESKRKEEMELQKRVADATERQAKLKQEKQQQKERRVVLIGVFLVILFFLALFLLNLPPGVGR